MGSIWYLSFFIRSCNLSLYTDRYKAFGVEKMHSLTGLEDKAIEEKVKKLVMAEQPQSEKAQTTQ